MQNTQVNAPRSKVKKGKWSSGIFECGQLCTYFTTCLCPAFIFHEAFLLYGAMDKVEKKDVKDEMEHVPMCVSSTCQCLFYPAQTMISAASYVPCLAFLAYNSYGNTDDGSYYEQEEAACCDICTQFCSLRYAVPLSGFVCAPLLSVYDRYLTKHRNRKEQIDESMFATCLFGLCCWPCSMHQVVKQLRVDNFLLNSMA